MTEKCKRCGGSGTVNLHNPPPGHMAYSPKPCPDCQPKEQYVKFDNDFSLDRLIKKEKIRKQYVCAEYITVPRQALAELLEAAEAVFRMQHDLDLLCPVCLKKIYLAIAKVKEVMKWENQES